MPRTRTKRKKKDPNRPKRPLTPYMVFVKETIKSVADSFPKDTKRSTIIKNCGERWRKLGAKKKDYFNRESQKDKERFLLQMEDYVPPAPEPAEKTGKRRKKDPDAPKRPLTAYMAFVSDHQQRLAKRHELQKDVMQEIGSLWRKTTDKDKKKYQKKADQDRERYRIEMEGYVKPETHQPKSKKEKKDPLKPKRVMSAYAFFVKEKRPQIAAKYDNNFENGKKIMKELGIAWAEATKKEKKKFVDKAARDKIRYNNQMDRYRSLMAQPQSKKAPAKKGGKRGKKAPAKRGGRRKANPNRRKAKV